jgi:hypothetical protein
MCHVMLMIIIVCDRNRYAVVTQRKKQPLLTDYQIMIDYQIRHADPTYNMYL